MLQGCIIISQPSFWYAMLSADMAENNNSRINLPEKDPDEWQIFYGIVVRDNSVRINDDNATMLPKWFH